MYMTEFGDGWWLWVDKITNRGEMYAQGKQFDNNNNNNKMLRLQCHYQ